MATVTLTVNEARQVRAVLMDAGKTLISPELVHLAIVVGDAMADATRADTHIRVRFDTPAAVPA